MFMTPDGLIHLTVQELLSLPLKHLVSGVDDDRLAPQRCGTVASISGFTEWVSMTKPAISIGWDWHLQPTQLGMRWLRVGLPRSNVMLQSKAPGHLDWQVSLVMLATLVDAMPWQQQVSQSLEHGAA